MPETRTYYEIVHDSACESTSHGIPFIFKRDLIAVRIAWTLCTLASAGVGCWLVAKSITDYYSWETVTQAKFVFETPTLFPTVTICSQNMFTTDTAFEYVENYTEVNNLGNIETKLNASYFSDNDFFKYGFGVNLLDTDFSDTFRKKMSSSLDDMILTCYYNNDPCWTQDFFWFFDPYYG